MLVLALSILLSLQLSQIVYDLASEQVGRSDGEGEK